MATYFTENPAGVDIFMNGIHKFVGNSITGYADIMTALRQRDDVKLARFLNPPVKKAITPVKVKPTKTQQVYVFDGPNGRILVKLWPNGKAYLLSGQYVCDKSDPRLKLRSASTKTVRNVLLKVPHASRADFYVTNNPVVAKAPKIDRVESIVVGAVAEQLGLQKSEIDSSKTLLELDGDSLDAVEIVMAIEDDLGCALDDDAAVEKVFSGQIKGMIDYVRSQLPVKN